MSDAPIGADLDEDEGPAPSWTRWLTLGSLVIAVIALGLTIWSVGPRTILDQLRAIGWGFLAIIGIEAVITCVDAAAISGFLGPGGRRPGYLYVLKAQLAGRALNAVTPGGTLGEATKATILLERTPSSRAIASIVRYNLTTIGMTLLSTAIGAPICALVLEVPDWLRLLLWIGAAVSAVLLVTGALLIHRGMLVTVIDVLARIRLVPRRKVGPWRASLGRIDRQLRGGRGSLLRRWAPALWVALSRVLTVASSWAVLAIVGQVLGAGQIAAMATIGPLISVASAVVPLGLGVSEGGNAAMFAAIGLPASLGVTVVLARRVMLIIYAVIGIVLMLTSSTIAQVRGNAGKPAPSKAPARA